MNAYYANTYANIVQCSLAKLYHKVNTTSLQVCHRTKYLPRIRIEKTLPLKNVSFDPIVYINVNDEIHFTMQSSKVTEGSVISIEMLFVGEMSWRNVRVVSEISVSEMYVGEMSGRRIVCRRNVLVPPMAKT